MKRNELMRDYWHYYRNLENKLIATSSYIEIHRDNFTAFSNEYALLLQSTGAELDNFFKVFCGYNLTDRKNINDYAGYILSSYPYVVNQIVTIPDRGIDLQPFAGWNTNAPAQSLNWCISFDEVKHNRAGNIKKANQENVLNIVSNLPIFEHFCHPIFDHRSIKKQPKLQFLIFDFRNVIEFSRSYSALVGGALFSSTWRLTA